jgi:hypothetical protein
LPYRYALFHPDSYRDGKVARDAKASLKERGLGEVVIRDSSICSE